MKSHAAVVGIIRVPGRGWPVKCPSCGNIGWFKERKGKDGADQAARNHRINN